VHDLQSQGLCVNLLSGDEPVRAQTVAQTLGIATAHGGLLPADKLTHVAAAQAAGHCVAMVGDGINDAPVLARADVSFAMGHAARIAQRQADFVLLRDRLGDVVFARRVARHAVRTLRLNLAWAAAYNATCVPLALAGWLPPWAAGIGMALSSLAVVLHSQRVLRVR
jgi:Cu2+-exporting ATPase